VIISLSGRRCLAFLSVCGIAATILAYITSFFGGWIDISLLWVAPLGFGALALGMPIRFIEPSSKFPSYFWTEFTQGMPKWVFPFLILVWLTTAAHFAWFSFHVGFGVPEIKDGQYVLDNHTEVLKVLTQSEYLSLKGAQVRMIATVMISMYAVPTIYWYFRRPE